MLIILHIVQVYSPEITQYQVQTDYQNLTSPRDSKIFIQKLCEGLVKCDATYIYANFYSIDGHKVDNFF